MTIKREINGIDRNIISMPLVDRKIVFQPLHIELGLSAVKALGKEGNCIRPGSKDMESICKSCRLFIREHKGGQLYQFD